MTEKQKIFTLPNQLDHFQEPLDNSALPYIKFGPSHITPDLPMSKLGGIPFLPKGTQFPKDPDGEQMLLLIQINFAEANFPAPFPTAGLLQFFVSPTVYTQAEDIQGFIFPSFYKVRFIAQLNEEDSNGQEHIQAIILPQIGLTFTQQWEPVSSTDYRLTEFVSPKKMQSFLDTHHQPFQEIYAQSFLAADQKLGGYPYFIGDDFREQQVTYRSFDTLLLQLISDDSFDFMWGDSGVLKFFITQQDLAQQNFSNVLFYAESY